MSFASATNPGNAEKVELGRTLFQDVTLSRDGKVSCRACHDPHHAYADPHPQSIGVDGKIGTRNAPSLISVGDNAAFFWDGRLTQLEEVVTGPFTNPAEFGLPTLEEVLARLRREPQMMANFHKAFPQDKDSPTLQEVRVALAAFIRSLQTHMSAYDRFTVDHTPLPPAAEQGRQLFEGAAGCNECHRVDQTSARFADDQYHHSGVGQTATSTQLPALTQAVIEQHLDANALGPKLLSDAKWSALGRFVVTNNPADIGAFRTPSLRNVAVTAPYMHDGSIATLTDAVDHEIYYRGFSRGHPINLSIAERQALVAFLESLTDIPNAEASKKPK